MSILHLLLDIYFTFALGVAGIAKLETPRSFASTLRYQYMFPSWSVDLIAKFFPWVEVLLALSLLLPIHTYEILVTCTLVFFFLFFLAIRLIALWKGISVKDCGCYGQSIQRSGPGMNLATLLTQVIFAFLLLATTLWTVALPGIYYFVSLLLVVSFYSWLLWNIWRKGYLLGTPVNFSSKSEEKFSEIY